MEKSKGKTSMLKKIIIGIIAVFGILFILSKLFPINYFEEGKQYYEEKKYEKAVKYLNEVEKNDENYLSAVDLIKEIQPIVDSINIAKEELKKKEEQSLEEKNKEKIASKPNKEEEELKNEDSQKEQRKEKEGGKKELSYEIIEEKEKVNPEFNFNKCNLEIRLKYKITNEELKRIAKELRKTRKSYDKLWIFYYLPDMKIGSGAWATTHFTPDLEINILGSTIEQEKATKNKANVVGNIIGKWYEEQYTSSQVVIYEDKNKTYIKTIYKNGQEVIEELTSRKINSKIKFKEINNLNGEYYILETDGNLGYYNKEDVQFTIGKKID